jgi:hypothetical protein
MPLVPTRVAVVTTYYHPVHDMTGDDLDAVRR